MTKRHIYEIRIVEQDAKDTEWMLDYLIKSMPYSFDTDVELYRDGEPISKYTKDEENPQWNIEELIQEVTDK